MDALGEELDEYFGIRNEVIQGSNVKIPDPPEALLLYNMCNEMHIPLVEGGLLDQPHIWLLEYGICDRKKTLYDIARQPNTNINQISEKDSKDLDIRFEQDK